MVKKRRMIVAISGATGIIYGIRLLEVLKRLDIETHLVISQSAQVTLNYETDMKMQELKELADVTYSVKDIGAAISSGSYQTMGMIVAPCSIKTMSQIAYSMTDNLIARAADVILKERKRLVLMLRETPLSLSHIRHMEAVTENGAIIFPPVPAFYTRPQTIDDIVNQTVGRVLDLFDIDTGEFKRWGEEDSLENKKKVENIK
ncbi:UbiX family flavin prenyltransferase [Priestia megaterium]|uniref:Flavin prenyltransferase UbiX n=1 Tax=Priestia megaterium TaxID=1404 RepID=A0ABD4WSK9_PRIMG|nr:UbiX family flavin prenyltransferase [Priestia megaterium]MDD9783124.1 UbiX family flavin prenyltransferase [Priestia megaterium]